MYMEESTVKKMENVIKKIIAHSVILPVHIRVPLNIVETTALRLLEEGRSQSYISKALGFDVSTVISELTEKRILNPDATFRNEPPQIEYKHGYIFFEPERGQFYNALLFPYELAFDEDSLLEANLGKDYIDGQDLQVYTLETFEVLYKNTENKHTRMLENNLTKDEQQTNGSGSVVVG